MDNLPVDALRIKLHNAHRLLLVTHTRPDGDAVGALLGMGMALQDAGFEVQMVLDDMIPSSLQHLPRSQQVKKQPEGEFDFIVVLDCSDKKRAGRSLERFERPTLNIDHHPTNDNFAEFNLIDPTASATCEMLAEYLPAWDLKLTEHIASALLTGIITDTIGFRTSNVTPKTLRLAAHLMELGAELSDLYMRSLVTRSFEAMRFWGAGLSQIQRDGPIVWTSLTRQDRLAAGYSGRDDADLINVISAVKDTLISIIFIEQPNGSVKVSWRAKPGIDVAQIACSFGGGGHLAAAGAEIEGDLVGVQADVLDKTRNLMQNSTIHSKL